MRWKTLFVLLFAIPGGVLSQTTINVLYANQDDNPIAEKAVEAAVEYVKQNEELAVTVEMFKVESTTKDAKGSLEDLCMIYQDMLDASKPPDIVLDTTRSSIGSESVKAFTRLLALPTIAGTFGQLGDIRQWRKPSESELKYLIQLIPPADIIPEVMKPIILNQNISNAAILFDKTFILQHKIKTLFQNVAIRHHIDEIHFNDVGTQIAQCKEMDMANFFILGNLETVKTVLNAAANGNFFNANTSWYVITQDMGEISCSACQEATIMLVKPTIELQYKKRFEQIMADFKLGGEQDISAAFYFDLALSTFLMTRDYVSNNSWSLTYLTCDDVNGKNLPKRPDVDVAKHFYQDKTEDPTFAPFEITQNGDSHMSFPMEFSAVQFSSGAVSKITPLGSWTAGFNSNMTLTSPEIMETFAVPKIYRIGIVIQAPFIMEDQNAERGYSGFCIDMLTAISAYLDFEYTLIKVEDNKYGNIDDNGTWDGLVRELIDQRIDIGFGAIALMSERENVIDFTYPYYDLVGFTIMMKLPKSPPSLFKFLTVLEDSVWLCILAAYFFTSFLMWIFDKYSPYSYQNNKEKYKDDEEKRVFDLKECLWFCMTSLTPQGGGEAPKNLSGRLVAATWWLFGFIIIASYTANLAAFLTVSRLDTPVESLDDLAKQYKIQYAPLNGSDTMIYFERMAAIENQFYEIWKDMSLNDSLSDLERAQLAVWDYPVSDKYTKMWQAMKEAKLPETLREAKKNVLDSKSASEGFAFIGDATDIRYMKMTDCDLQMVGEEFSKKPYALAVQQDSPLRQQLNKAIMHIQEEQLLEKLKTKWWDDNPRQVKCEKTVDDTDGISIDNIGGVFIVIIVGIFLAILTLCFEYWWYKRQRRSTIIRKQDLNVNQTVVAFPRSNNEPEIQSNLYRRYNAGQFQ